MGAHSLLPLEEDEEDDEDDEEEEEDVRDRSWRFQCRKCLCKGSLCWNTCLGTSVIPLVSRDCSPSADFGEGWNAAISRRHHRRAG